MRRRTRRGLVNLALFGSALFIIIYLNRPPSNNNSTFAWTTIRYQTTSTILPRNRGVCPGLADSSKPALVVARVAADGDPDWLDALADSYHLCVYTATSPTDAQSTYLQVPANRGHEAMAYLTFLIDNYADVPAAGAVFVHGARRAWHNDEITYDNAVLLASLNVSAALAVSGYHNLRCDWGAGTCSPAEAPPQGSLETAMRARLEPWNARAISDAALPGALAALFGGGGDGSAAADLQSGGADGHASSSEVRGKLLLSRTDAVRAQCCAQFVVARDRVWRHSRAEYVALRQWLLDGDDVAPRDDRVAGRIVSYLWHILFLPRGDVDLETLNALACPRADECYCRLYGRCDLEGCTSPGHCRGQYFLPPDFRLPSND